MSKRVFIVMSNDFPDCVFGEEWKAEIYVDLQMKWQKFKLGPHMSPRIYYRYYAFELDLPGEPSQITNRHYNQELPTEKDKEDFRASLRAAWEERRRALEASA